MKALETHLNIDTSAIIFKFLINGDDYTPFTIDDIKLLSKEITEWNECAQWAAKEGRSEILEYISILGKSVNWIMCANNAAFHGHTNLVNYIRFDILYGYLEMGDYYELFCSAVEGGHLDTVISLDIEPDEDRKPPWENDMCYAAEHKQLEIVKYFGAKVIDLGIMYADREEYMKSAKKGGDPRIIRYVETMFDWKH